MKKGNLEHWDNYDKYTNLLLNSSAHSKEAAFKVWRDYIKFIGFSCESVKAKKPALSLFFDCLLIIFTLDIISQVYINEHFFKNFFIFSCIVKL